MWAVLHKMPTCSVGTWTLDWFASDPLVRTSLYPLSLSLSHTHTHTRTCTRTHTHTDIPFLSRSLNEIQYRISRWARAPGGLVTLTVTRAPRSATERLPPPAGRLTCANVSEPIRRCTSGSVSRCCCWRTASVGICCGSQVKRSARPSKRSDIVDVIPARVTGEQKLTSCWNEIA